jgi:pyruvate kinase
VTPETRQTKILGTLGPASASAEMIEALIRAGLDAARLNFSHGTHDDHRRNLRLVREAEAKIGRPVAVLQDLQGPKIRLGKLDGKVELKAGSTIVLSSDNDFIGNPERLPTTYERLADDVRTGETVLLADGALELSAKEIKGRDVVCEVRLGGTVSSNKGMNMPGSTLTIPAASAKDLSDLECGVEMGVDYVALSFVRAPHDVIALRERMDKIGRRVPIISKIEKPQAVERLQAIIDVSDGIMVARGDLGVELPAEQVPTVQRRAIRLARQRGKLSIVATQMLVSMTRHPRPTHAEVSDVANAVFDGADAVMLSEETAAGEYPVRAVEMMSAVASAADGAQNRPPPPPFVEELRNSNPGAISRAAAGTAEDMGARAIAAFTDFGLGPRLISNWRPRCEILGLASRPEATRRMALYWGVRPHLIAEPTTLEELVETVERAAREVYHLPTGSTVVITSKTPFVEAQLTNVLTLHTIGGGPRA